VTRVTVYSNLPEVELLVNGESLGKKTAEDHFFYFDVPNVGESTIVAKAGELTDEGHLRKVDVFNEEYRLVEKGAILNWFDIKEIDGRLSLNSKMGEVISTFRGKLLFMKLMGKMLGGKKKGGKPKAAGFEVTSEMMAMMNGFTVLRLLTMAGGMMNCEFTKEDLLKLNKKLNRIKRPAKKN
jgi:beta-galactosidase